jgi:hypothetical protein
LNKAIKIDPTATTMMTVRFITPKEFQEKGPDEFAWQ